jgi:N-acylneuraminate cytidylyltransferase
MKVCLIPARGGSKRIPKKNIKPFLGKPIIAYSIESALNSGCFDEVMVSTDCPEIAAEAEKYGAKVPFVRPPELSDDYCTTIDVIKHTVNWYSNNGCEISHLCCLYATSPFASGEDLSSAYHKLIESNSDYCVSVAEYTYPIQRALRSNDDARIEMIYPEHESTRSQDLETALHDAGQFYWGKAEAFLLGKPLLSKFTTPYLLPSYRVQDIDTLDDWKRAELLYKLSDL